MALTMRTTWLGPLNFPQENSRRYSKPSPMNIWRVRSHENRDCPRCRQLAGRDQTTRPPVGDVAEWVRPLGVATSRRARGPRWATVWLCPECGARFDRDGVVSE